MKWWVACRQMSVGPFRSEEEAIERALFEDKYAGCRQRHRYWAAEFAPTYNTEKRSVNIPVEAKVAPTHD